MYASQAKYAQPKRIDPRLVNEVIRLRLARKHALDLDAYPGVQVVRAGEAAGERIADPHNLVRNSREMHRLLQGRNDCLSRRKPR